MTVVSCRPAPVAQSQAWVPRMGNMLGTAEISAMRSEPKASPIRTRLSRTLAASEICSERTMSSVAKVVRTRKPPTSASAMPASAILVSSRATMSLSAWLSRMVGMKPVTSAWLPSSVMKRLRMKGPTASNTSSRVKPVSV
ncbi:hypothetical protein D3C87_1756610 [compost metagenome]